MEVLDFITLLIIMAAFFTLINVKFLKLPSTIGLMLLALGLSLFIIVGEWVFKVLHDLATNLMTEYDFSKVLFQVMLSFLLFAGALELDLRKLGEEKWPIFALATVGVLISTLITGTVMYYVLPLVSLPLDYIYCLLFGALIAPTDPISVLAMMKKTTVSKNLESQIAGESLFNDGVGVVVFLTILSIASKGVDNFHAWGALELFGVEVIGGLALGAFIGYTGLYLLKIIDNEHTEIEVLVTLSMVLGGASIAEIIHVSGPLAMVVMGLFVGRKGRNKALETAAGDYVYKFWHLMDEAMNAILFILIGLQVIVIKYEIDYFYAAGFAILAVLFSRFIGVGLPISIMRLRRYFPTYTIRILTWSGLRGGISVALALSLYETTDFDRKIVDIIITMTYCVVLFSIVGQGLTVKKLFDKFNEVNDTKTSAKAANTTN
ncbi:sodium:proton antiporter [Fulvivirga sp. M361]|uniref:cation:proton antiporter n=1 Tax=Fulvivirga sp. M361 TaxID=2594266 RepID=UPI00117AEC28|nr:sodium:proton antiporter [Fulvivirga sp. M361]TRX52437.1 sodium:proton antiporter [Fulvivirga sp. M361]